jgi:hypothetical protein
MRKDIVTNTNEFQRIIREYPKNLYSNALENLKEIYKFLDLYALPKLSQEDINHLHISITSNETETVIKSPPTKKSPGPYRSLLNSTRPLKN